MRKSILLGTIGALILSLGTIPMEANAGQVVLGGMSWHMGSSEFTYQGETKDINYQNPGIGFETDEGYGVMVMKNSYYNTSFVLSKIWVHDINEDWSTAFRIGAATGYKDTPLNMDLLPIAQVELHKHWTKNFTTVLGYMPPATLDYAGILTMHMKYKF